ncbi:MAG TPA: superoxide dismutase [Candidatus Hydrogenedentes bacterium]|jgi:Fe-Mn family superoxide dismutase|nr:MAG: Superoxide dismutase (Fe) [Candidatus Hydrogenedentes bacterium ADurb.Bin170]HNZ49152.1 superoxide dismutase [Candidatus Hydrogenedentota bacterium]HOD96580.1 superoxide dismutase [Candidatus Hydrogenedentota bacterium]HOH42577.1 superoxide dismutase [Candidatus Hydrogenedentota bacterium]HOM47459.1 superoxide dismutase [Candidatus Hydrogenedentota bacterium]
MSFSQPPLPYDLGALNPFVSEEQMSFHYGKHHLAYFNNLNGLVDGKPEADMALLDVVKQSEGGVFNNSAQAWNHSFFWHCMSPGGGGAPAGDIASRITRDFGSFDVFKEQFSSAAAKLFGSGWAWLAADASGKLEIMPLSNADTPVRHGKTAILTLDVWEHAYYIDYRNLRPKFIEGFWDVVNWDFANKNLVDPFKE